MPYCNQCGGQVSATANFCDQCGGVISNNPSTSVHPSASNQRHQGGKRRFLKWTGIGCGGLLFLLVLLIVIGALVSSNEEEIGAQRPGSPPTPTPTFQEVLAQASTVSYDELFRNNERYVGTIVHYRGKVEQVVEGRRDDSYELRVNVTEGDYFWEDTVYLNYSGQRLLENDIIEFVGEVKGLKTYGAVFGQQITIPEIDVLQTRLAS